MLPSGYVACRITIRDLEGTEHTTGVTAKIQIKKMELLRAIQAEIRRHTFDTFVDAPAMAQGGRGTVSPGCPACRKRLFTMQNFMDHICDEELPAALDKASLA